MLVYHTKVLGKGESVASSRGRPMVRRVRRVTRNEARMSDAENRED